MTSENNIERIKELSKVLFEQQEKHFVFLPSKFDVAQTIESLLRLLFSGYYGTKKFQNVVEIENKLITLYKKLKEQIAPFVEACEVPSTVDVEQSIHELLVHLPQIHQDLWLDAQALFNEDPAAVNLKEVVLAYPGFYATAVYRIAHVFCSIGVPVFPRMIAEYAHEKTGIDIHPCASIGKSFVIDHGTGVVIGETCNIGDRVKIYQGVTLGALSVEKNMAQQKRHPTIENDVVIYAGATILGGETCIGHDSIIGGNVWLTESVPPHSVLYYQHDTHNKLQKK